MSENTNPHVVEYEHVALLLIDVINDYNFEDGEKLLEHAKPMTQKITLLKKRAKVLNIPVLYINDNYGRWQSDFAKLVEHCKRKESRGKDIVQLIEPDDDDYFVLKPQFSAFYLTPLELLLDYLNVKSLIITGAAGNMCVQFTANDAYMRGYKLYLPQDCIASNEKDDNVKAIDLMEKVLKADTTPSEQLDLEKIKYEWRN